ncbi:MAG TPA: hypothetical protein VKY39_03325 [Aggregatilineales bacterium]|nr:hypothetical protein [Aggregatilineales bacterium]
MRVLHPIRPEEKLVSRGRYRYLIDGEPTGDLESWQITRLPNGDEFVRADLDGRESSGASLITHLLRREDGRPAVLRLRFEHEDVKAVAQYTFDEASVQVARTAEGEQRCVETVDIATGYVVDYHTMISQDYVWRGYEGVEGYSQMVPLFSPDLWVEKSQVLHGRALRFEVQPLPPTLCVVPAGAFAGAQHYRVRFEDGVEAEAWYDSRGIPLRWQFPARGYDFVLDEYQAQP